MAANLTLSSQTSPGLRAARLDRWILPLVAVLALGVYANSLSNGFVLDDVGIIHNNPAVQELQWSAIWTQNYWPTPEAPPDFLYRPLTIFTYLANHALTPHATWPYHVVNVVLHALVSMMVALLAWRIFRRGVVALLAGAVFAVHPIHTEVVANVVGRAELLAAFWSLAALVVFLPEGAVEDGVPAVRAWWHGPLVAACLLLAMLSKETPVAMVPAFVFLDFWRWSVWGQRGMAWPTFWRWMLRQTVRYHVFLWLALAGYLTARVYAVGLAGDIRAIHPVVNPLVIATIPERIVTPFVLFAKYLLLMIWPKVLVCDYSAPSLLPTANPLQPQAALGILLVVAAVLMVVTRWKRVPGVVLVIILTALSYALVANVLRIGTIFGERLFYWPSVFVSILLALGAEALWRGIARVCGAGLFRQTLVRCGSVAVVVLALAGLAARTIVRNPDWHDNISMALATAHDNPDSAKACIWAGAELYQGTTEPWMQDFGAQLLERAIVLYPTDGQSYWDLAKYHGRRNHLGQSLCYLARGAYFGGGRLEMRQGLRYIHEELKRHPESEYLPAAKAYAEQEPGNPAAHFALGMALWAKGDVAGAEGSFRSALTLATEFDECSAELGRLKLEEGDAESAVILLRHYVKRIRYNGEARCELAEALMRLDPVKYPTAFAESSMNLGKAEALLPGQAQVRELRLQWQRRRPAGELPSGVRALSSAKSGS